MIVHGLRFELLTDDPEEFFNWKRMIEEEMMVRKNGQLTTSLTFQKAAPPLVIQTPGETDV